MNNNNKKSADLQDYSVNIKIKLAALWASVTLCFIYADYFELYVPEKVEGLISGDNGLDTPSKLFMASILLTIPAVMVFLSLIMKPYMNRLINLILGSIYTVIMVLLIAFTSWEPWRIFYIFMAVVESILTSIIVWNAWKWPKREVQS